MVNSKYHTHTHTHTLKGLCFLQKKKINNARNKSFKVKRNTKKKKSTKNNYTIREVTHCLSPQNNYSHM